MGRKKSNCVYKYFELNDDNTSTCLLPDCGKNLKTQHGANLLKHLKYIHKQVYMNVSNINNSRDSFYHNTKQNSVSETVLTECTNLIAIHGRPFEMLEDQAFQNLLTLIPENKISINAKNVKENLQIMANNMRRELAMTLEDKIISLKIDIASFGSRSFMGINCQYLVEGKLIMRNLGVIEIFQRHSSEDLKDLLISNLLWLHINEELKKKVYCVTTDNGANMIKMDKLWNYTSMLISDNIDEKVYLCEQSDPSTNQIITETTRDVEANESVSNCDIINCQLDSEEACTTQLTDMLRAHLFPIKEENLEYKIGVVRCAAHTLQLAIQDAYDDVTFRNVISNCRKVVRYLRTPNYISIIRDQNKIMPQLDCATRWTSTFDMIESLISLQDICCTNIQLYLPESTWDTLKEYHRTLQPAKELSKKLEEEQLTVGDFYIAWMLCLLKLSKITTHLSTAIVTAMKAREVALFQNDIFVNGIFLDPRTNSVLTSAQQNAAKNNLIVLYLNIFKLEQNGKGYCLNSNNGDKTNTGELSEAQIELDAFLNESYLNKHNNFINSLDSDRHSSYVINALQESMDAFLKEPLLQSSESVLQYWEKAREKYPLLYKLSTVALAAPVTQVSVERLLSSLKFVLSNDRFSMKDDVIEDLIFVRSNKVFK